jgi:hypothetical protein
MSIDGMREAWGPLFELAQDFYRSANPSLLQNEVFDSSQFEEVEPLLDEMLRASERIRRKSSRELWCNGTRRHFSHRSRAATSLPLASAWSSRTRPIDS